MTVLTAVAVGWMLFFFARSGSRHPVLPIALGLLIGGSASNLTDRVRLGHVTDFIDLRFWPAFNLADSFIVLGVLVLLAALLLPQRGTTGRGLSLTRTVRVPDEAAGARLDRFLAELPEIGSRSAAERLLAGGAVRVDGSLRAKSHRLEGGEEVEFEPPEVAAPAIEAQDVPFRVAYEDVHLLVVDKPAGVVVHPGAGHDTGTLVHGLAGQSAGGDEDRPGIVHRLDRDTSGLLVVARSDEAHERLQQLVRRPGGRAWLRRARPRPPAVVAGRIDAPIGRDRDDPTRRSLDTDTPREAVTHFEVAELLSGHALLDVRLETGRTHQIRVHSGGHRPPRGRGSRLRRARAGARPSVPAREPAGVHASVHQRARPGRVTAPG